jgi:hypothetical protein
MPKEGLDLLDFFKVVAEAGAAATLNHRDRLFVAYHDRNSCVNQEQDFKTMTASKVRDQISARLSSTVHPGNKLT